MFLIEFLSQIADVVAVITVLGKLDAGAENLKIAGAHRLAKALHLGAGIVEVVFAVHVAAGPLKRPADAVADGGVAGVANVQRAGRIGADEFHQSALAQHNR